MKSIAELMAEARSKVDMTPFSQQKPKARKLEGSITSREALDQLQREGQL